MDPYRMCSEYIENWVSFLIDCDVHCDVQFRRIPDGDDMFVKLEQYVERGMDYAM